MKKLNEAELFKIEILRLHKPGHSNRNSIYSLL